LEWQNAAAPNTYVVIEGISYGSTIKTSSVFDLAGLNYMIRTAMMKFSSNLIIAPPSHVKKFATGSGNANKELMIETFKSIHPEFDIPKIDDIADAFFMSRLAQRYFEQDKF
jgi:crossover junction endodeoxyribonuclease RuvC